MHDPDTIRAAHMLLPCEDLQESLDFFVEQLGFRLDRICPADDPRMAQLSGHGLAVELRRGGEARATHLSIACDDVGGLPEPLVAPNGTHIEFVSATPAFILPPLEEQLVVQRLGESAEWIVGRAGMRYRDLIPGRLGGRFIASHIQIPEGGPVPDFVHFHQLRFQMIFCVKGWVDVVYEDQGPPMRLEAGDCFLQPPLIRHRVLECSPGLEVVEISSPAEHDTFLDHELELPTPELHPDRNFSGQQFVLHRAATAEYGDWTLPGFECRDLGIAAATVDHASARVVRSTDSSAAPESWAHDHELLFFYVLEGALRVDGPRAEPIQLAAGDSVAIPSGLEFTVAKEFDRVEFLEVRY